MTEATENKEPKITLRLARAEREMFKMLAEGDAQSLNGEAILLIRAEFKRRKLKLPDPLPETKLPKGKQ